MVRFVLTLLCILQTSETEVHRDFGFRGVEYMATPIILFGMIVEKCMV